MRDKLRGGDAMGTMISLDIGKFEIDYGKNDYFYNHSALFQNGDRKKILYFFSDDYTDIKYGYQKKLGLIKDRLDLLGFTIVSLKNAYEAIIKTKYELRGFLKFEQLAYFLKSIDISEIVANGVDWSKNHPVGFGLMYLVNYKKFSKYLPKNFRKKRFDEESYSYLPMYLLLRLLAENPKNHDFDVSWKIGDTIESGWVKWSDVKPKINENQYVWIVTEGSSDSKVIQRAINTLHPHVADIFRYIDMQENYPFTGTGELTKFFKGLAKIGVLNKMLFIFDNDTEGLAKYEELTNLKERPANLMVCHLPNMDCFNDFLTTGATGEQRCNINGKAVSIECFLDLSYGQPNPLIRWGGYNEKKNKYQGSLVNKDSYLREFTDSNLRTGNYDLSKINFLIKHIFSIIAPPHHLID